MKADAPPLRAAIAEDLGMTRVLRELAALGQADPA